MQRRSYSNKKLLGWAIVMSSILSACNQYSQPITHGSLIFWTKSQIEKSAILPRKQGFCEHAA